MEEADRSRVIQDIVRHHGPAWARIFTCLGPVNGLAIWRTSVRSKLVTRIVTPEQRFFAVVDDLRNLGLKPLVAPFGYSRASECQTNPLAALHIGGFVQSSSAETEDAVIYMALHRPDAEQAMLCDLSADHAGVAEFFGYPSCCAEAFTAGLTGSGYGLSIFDQIGPFDSLLNPVTRYFNRVRPIFHFPCRLDCEASRALAHQGRADLVDLSPRLANLADLGAGVLVSRPGIGLYWYVREEAGERAFCQVKALAQDGTRLTPNSKTKITVEASDKFAVDDVWCKELGSRCLEFSIQAPPEAERTSLL